jgi:TPP-dependent indolepyruvate ferredoxin oxidoreductase alpha subunit
MNNKNYNSEEKALDQNELKDTSGGILDTGTYYIDLSVCAQWKKDCIDKDGDCRSLSSHFCAAIDINKPEIRSWLCLRCGGCLDINWCKHEAIKYSPV